MVESAPARTASQAINREKWTGELLRAGWVMLPNVIIEKQRELGLDPVDLNIVLHLATHWWERETLPHPSVARMAAAMGMSPRQLSRRLTSLHKRGLVTRQVRGTVAAKKTNKYDLRGLIEAAEPHARQMAAERAVAREMKKERRLAAPPSVNIEGF